MNVGTTLITMKKLLLFSLLFFASLSSYAQFLGFKGFIIQAETKLYIEDGEPKSAPTDQIFNISFKDGIFVHTIFIDGYVDESQVYLIKNQSSYVEDGITIYTFDAVSGLSGSVYKYEIKITEEGKLDTFKLTTPSGSKYIYKGRIIELKTYKQE